MTTPSSPDQSQRLYSAAIAELALERAARLQTLASEQDRALAEAEAETAAAPAEPEGFDRAELIAAARGAGIDPAFVEVALAEVDSRPPEVREQGRASAKDHARLTRWLGTKRRNVMVTRRFEAAPEQVWAVFQGLVRDPMSGLELVRIIGGHPAEGGIAVCNARPLYQGGQMGYSTMAYRLHQLDLGSVQVTLEPEGEGTRLRVVGDLEPGMRKNLKVARVLSGLVGVTLGACVGMAGMATGIGVAIAGGMAGMLGSAGTMAGLWRWTYPRALVGFEDELGTLLDKLASELTLAGPDAALGGGPPLSLAAG